LEMVEEFVQQSGQQVDIYVGRTGELIRAAKCCLACSGSVSLELLYHQKPAVILYWISRWFYGFVKLCIPLLQIKAKYITLVNMLADQPFTARPSRIDPDQHDAERIPYPEFVTYKDKSEQIAGYVIRWLTDEVEWQRRHEQLRQLRQEVAHGGASERTARYILEKLAERPEIIPRPHFRAGINKRV
ncbi:MAG: hypothetical protein N2C12_15080, partial [Planctomycetales bacterium]